MEKLLVRRRLLLAVALFVAVIGVVGLLGSRVDVGAQGGPPVEEGTESRDTNEKLEGVGNEVPGFGGMYLDPNDRNVLKVFLLDPANSNEAGRVRQAIADEFPDVVPSGGISLVKGDYSMVQLSGWYDDLRRAVAQSDDIRQGLVFTDLQEGSNRLDVGVDREALVSKVKAVAADVGVPAGALRVFVEERFEFWGGPEGDGGSSLDVGEIGTHHQTIRHRFRPLFGGLQSEGDDRGICTYGFNAIRSNVNGFVVPSHCTDEFAETESTEFYQPTESSNNKVGEETVDGSTFSCTVWLQEYDCRRADVAFIRFDSGIAGDMGHIARTTGNGSHVISHTNPRWRIVSDGGGAAVGQIIVIVGRYTGTYTPIVDRLCFDAYNGARDVMMVCQERAQAPNLGSGDSGAPVFRILNSPQNGDVRLHGIMFGGNSSHILYSPMSQIQSSTELGSLRTCALEIGC